MFEVGTVLRPRTATGTVMVVIAIDGDAVTYAPKGWESSSALHRTASMAKLSATVAEQEVKEEPAPSNMGATITQTYGASERRYNLYTLTLDERANELRNAIVAYGAAHNHPDDAYILARGLMGCILAGDASVNLGQPEVDLIATVTTWAQSLIARYRTQNAAEISEYEACEGKTLTDTEVFGYAVANPPAEASVVIPPDAFGALALAAD